eukprot:COSAG06_NODE_1006_length_11107_cov_10.602017_10_plen_122_part_00
MDSREELPFLFCESGPCSRVNCVSKRRTHLVASRSMSERYGIDVIRSWTSEVGLNGPGSTTAADCLRGAISVCDSFDLSLRSVRGNTKGCRDLWLRCRQPGAYECMVMAGAPRGGRPGLGR